MLIHFWEEMLLDYVHWQHFFHWRECYIYKSKEKTDFDYRSNQETSDRCLNSSVTMNKVSINSDSNLNNTAYRATTLTWLCSLQQKMFSFWKYSTVTRTFYWENSWKSVTMQKKSSIIIKSAELRWSCGRAHYLC